MSKHLTIHACGTARNNPGSAGVGLVIADEFGQLTLISENVGIATTVQAQYQAVIMALLWATEHKCESVEIFIDNVKMIRSLLHNPSVSDLNIIGLHKRARRLARSLKVNFSLSDRSVPNRADTLALEASLRDPAENESEKPGRPDSGSAHKHEAVPSGPPSSEEVTVRNRHAIQQSAGGVVYKKEDGDVKICLISKKGGTVWALPKGRIKSGETWERAATREILEETGHLATISERIDQIEYYFYWRDNHTLYYKLVTFFLMPVIQEDAAPPDGEACEIGWFSLGEAWHRLYYQSEKNILSQARSILQTAKIL